MLLFISTSEVLFVIFIAFLLFGAKRIPEIARGLGKSVGELKKVTDDIKKEITQGNPEIIDKVNELQKTATNITKEIKDATNIVDDLKG